MRAPILSLLFLASVACSSGGAGTPNVGGGFDYCSAARARASRCESGTSSAADCEQTVTCFNNAVRAEVREEILRCMAERACGASDDPCVEGPAARYASDPDVTTYVESCNSKRTSCSGGFSDDYCSASYGLFNTTLRGKMRECLNLGCTEVRNCFNAAYESLGCD